jgi:hypothetical protein
VGLKLDEGKPGINESDALQQQILTDIMTGLKKKMLQPLLEDNRKLAAKIEQLRAEGQTANKELLLRVEVLESTIQQMPLMLLAALRDAINQVGGGMEDA